MIHREHIEWCDIWVTAASDNSRSRVLLIGDSIVRSYYPHVQQQLAEHYACARIATSKCVADPAFFREFELVLEEYVFSVIHFNNGLHGWDYDENAYATGLAKAFDLLLAHGDAPRLIWGSTTPVWQKGVERILDAKTERVRQRNTLAAALAAERGIRVNDLFAEVIDQPELFSKDGVHFLENGQLVLGKCVASAILEKAPLERH